MQLFAIHFASPWRRARTRFRDIHRTPRQTEDRECLIFATVTGNLPPLVANEKGSSVPPESDSGAPQSSPLDWGKMVNNEGPLSPLSNHGTTDATPPEARPDCRTRTRMTPLLVKFVHSSNSLCQHYGENEPKISLNTVCILKNAIRVSNDGAPLFVVAASYPFFLYPNIWGFENSWLGTATCRRYRLDSLTTELATGSDLHDVVRWPRRRRSGSLRATRAVYRGTVPAGHSGSCFLSSVGNC